MQYEVSPTDNLLAPEYKITGEASWNSWRKTAVLVKHLTWRSLASRYRGSALGFVWSLVNPILMMFVYTFVFKVIFRANDSGVPFSVYLMTGILAWNFFSSAAIHASVSLVANGSLVNKCSFPRIALPLSAVCANAVNYLVALPLLLAFILISGVKLTPSLLLLPAALVILAIIATGLGALLAALMPFFMDLQHLIEVLFTMWFFLTPVVYFIGQIDPPWLPWYQLNPMVGIVTFVHNVFLGLPFQGTFLAVATVESLIILVIGLWVFGRLSVHCTEV